MRNFSTAVIGAGPAGMLAAISAKRICGQDVVIFERMPQIGKKILASGNGRCNLSNEHINQSHYNLRARPFVSKIFNRFGKDDIVKFFRSLGLELCAESDGRIFPATNQSSSVLKVLELELNRLAIPIELNFRVENISDLKDSFVINPHSGKEISCRKLILAGGGRSYPALGSDGSAYEIAAAFGHKLVKPVPAAVPVVVRDQMCHLLQGQKIEAKLSAFIDGKKACEASGDLMFTKYGLSGTAVLDISEDISVAVNRDKKKDVAIYADLVPYMDEDRLCGELDRRISSGWANEDLLAGILPNKFGVSMKESLKKRNAKAIAAYVKAKRFVVIETKSWNEAEFTSGGIELAEVKEGSLESKLKKGLYFAGEILDVTGRRGGYNLAWAWASGHVAGLTE